MPPVNINCNALLYLPEPNEKLYSEYTQMKLGDSKYQVISDRAHGSSDTAHAHDRNWYYKGEPDNRRSSNLMEGSPGNV